LTLPNPSLYIGGRAASDGLLPLGFDSPAAFSRCGAVFIGAAILNNPGNVASPVMSATEAATAPNTTNFRLVVLRAPTDHTLLGEVFRDQLHLNGIDALGRARRMPGVLKDHLTREQAEALAVAIREAGWEAVAVPVNELPDPAHAETVHHARCSESGLALMGLSGEVESQIAWEAVRLLCIGEAPLETSRHYRLNERYVTAGQYLHGGPLDLPTPPSLQLWIECLPPTTLLVVAHQHMNYEYLGSRRTDSATVNFRSFVDDLVRFAPRAVRTPSTEAYLNGHDSQRYRFNSADDLAHHVVWQIMLARQTHVPAADPAAASPATSE
jgi:hypothetical protein